MASGIPQLAHMAGAGGAVSWYNQRWYEYTGTTLEKAKFERRYEQIIRYKLGRTSAIRLNPDLLGC
jgi:hypothetical protein